MKTIFVCILTLTIGIKTQAQDEYQKPVETKIEEKPDQDRSTKDSVKIFNQSTELKDDIKGYKGLTPFQRNFRLGGGFTLSSFYNNSLNVQMAVLGISPQATMMMSDYFEGGISTSYLYQGSFGDANLHSISLGPIFRAYPIEGYFIQVEGVISHISSNVKEFKYSDQFVNVYAGLGWVGRISEKSFVLTGIKVNLMKNELTFNQIYPVPFASVHFNLW